MKWRLVEDPELALKMLFHARDCVKSPTLLSSELQAQFAELFVSELDAILTTSLNDLLALIAACVDLSKESDVKAVLYDMLVNKDMFVFMNDEEQRVALVLFYG